MLATLIVLALGINGFLGWDSLDSKSGTGTGKLDSTAEKLYNIAAWNESNLTFYCEWFMLTLFSVAWFVKGRGGGFLFLDDTSKTFSKPWWWGKKSKSEPDC